MRVVVRHVDDLDADIEILDRRPGDVRADLPLRTVRVEGRERVEVRAARGGDRPDASRAGSALGEASGRTNRMAVALPVVAAEDQLLVK
jgi:hypothetical protein